MDYPLIVAGILISVIGYFLMNLHDELKMHRKDIQAIQVDLPTTYVQKSELKDLFERIYNELVQIKIELRHKEDKQDGHQ